jgi:hypothetical protein
MAAAGSRVQLPKLRVHKKTAEEKLKLGSRCAIDFLLHGARKLAV